MDDKPDRPGKATQFKPGNPGKPKGSRNALGEAFISALHADFQKHGTEVITRVREERPQDYMKVVASILPREVKVTSEVDDMTDAQILDRIRQIGADFGLTIREAEGVADADERPAGPAGHQ